MSYEKRISYNTHEDIFGSKSSNENQVFVLETEYSHEKFYALNQDNFVIKAGDFVFCKTKYGIDLVKVLYKFLAFAGNVDALVRIEGKASDEDMKRKFAFSGQKEEAKKLFKNLVLKHDLGMKFVAVHFLLSDEKVIFFFTANGRVDFRSLVKDLVSIFRIRIELRQVSDRDKCCMLGSCGVCGRECCCSLINSGDKPGTMKMAKNQDIQQNPSKLTGQCGRIMCCLSFEDVWYREEKQLYPFVGCNVYFQGELFRVKSVNLMKKNVLLLGEQDNLLEVSGNNFYKEDNRWIIRE